MSRRRLHKSLAWKPGDRQPLGLEFLATPSHCAELRALTSWLACKTLSPQSPVSITSRDKAARSVRLRRVTSRVKKSNSAELSSGTSEPLAPLYGSSLLNGGPSGRNWIAPLVMRSVWQGSLCRAFPFEAVRWLLHSAGCPKKSSIGCSSARLRVEGGTDVRREGWQRWEVERAGQRVAFWD